MILNSPESVGFCFVISDFYAAYSHGFLILCATVPSPARLMDGTKVMFFVVDMVRYSISANE